jgi:hypothetical protein
VTRRDVRAATSASEAAAEVGAVAKPEATP